jgi:hypothetical protein
MRVDTECWCSTSSSVCESGTGPLVVVSEQRDLLPVSARRCAAASDHLVWGLVREWMSKRDSERGRERVRGGCNAGLVGLCVETDV